jgi:hypothetical protein
MPRLLGTIPVDVVSTPGDPWWRIVLDVSIAMGTIAAAVAAAWAARAASRIAKEDRRAADDRGEMDRQAGAKRASDAETFAGEQAEQEHERNARRFRLDHLLAVAESFEEERALLSPDLPHRVSQGMRAGTIEHHRAAGVLRARLAASPDRLPAVQAALDGERPTLAVVNDVLQQYRTLLPKDKRDAMTNELQNEVDLIARTELYGKIREARRMLYDGSQ